MSSRPVAIFDSGIGGLSVAREIHRALPAEELLYLADHAYLPYGMQTTAVVRERTLAAAEYLQGEGAKVLVVACNTASGAALEHLRAHLAIPVIGLEPAVKPAVRESRNGRVGVMATVGTLASERYARLVSAYANGATVIPQPCPGLADLIEDGHLDDDELRTAVALHAEPLRRAGVDTVVLGCTHYPFVRDAIAAALGPEVRIIDSAPAIARQTERILREHNALADNGEGAISLLTTGDPTEVAPVVARVWGAPIPVARVDLPAPAAV